VASGVRPEIATVVAWNAPQALLAASAAEMVAPEPSLSTEIDPLEPQPGPRTDGLEPQFGPFVDGLEPRLGPRAARLELADPFLPATGEVDLSKFDVQALGMELEPPPEAKLVEHWDDVSICVPLNQAWTFDMAYRHGGNDTVLDSMGNPIFGSIAGTVQNVEPAVENFVVGFRWNF